MTCTVDNSSVNNCEAVVPALIEDTPCTDSEEPCCSNDIPVQSPILESEKSCQVSCNVKFFEVVSAQY